MRNPFELDFWSIFGPLRPLRNIAHGSKFEGFQVCKPRLKKDPKSRPGGPYFRAFSTFYFFFGPSGGPKIPNWRFLRFLSAFFCKKICNAKTSEKKRNDAQVGAMRGAGGRGGRVALACITLRVFAGVGAGVCMQAFVRRLARRWGAADSIATRIPPSQAWWIGASRIPGFCQIDMQRGCRRCS